MNKQQQIISTLKTQGLLPLYFHRNKETSVLIMRALYTAGVRLIEYTNRGAEALDNFKELVVIRNKELPGLFLAAGTIKTKAQAEHFIDAGTDFIISPGLIGEVAEASISKNIFWIPGCMTPSEIILAEKTGAKMIKLFPGNLLGPGFLAAIKEIFPKLLFIPTGGVKLENENLSAWFKSGVTAVGAGSTLIDKSAVDTGDFAAIEKTAGSALAMIAPFLSKL